VGRIVPWLLTLTTFKRCDDGYCAGLGLACPRAELCWREELTAEANCLFL